MNISILFFPIIFILTGCLNNKNGIADSDYIRYKSEFNIQLIQHFPTMPISTNYSTFIETDTAKNNVCFIFTYKHLGDSIFQNLLNDLKTRRYLSEYQSMDTSLFFVNPFETINTYSNYKMPYIDTTVIEKNIYQTRLPIPNVFNVKQDYYFATIGINANAFKIFVLDANSNYPFQDYRLKQDPQMPKDWRNGYSNGYAINENDKVIIYWLVIW